MTAKKDVTPITKGAPRPRRKPAAQPAAEPVEVVEATLGTTRVERTMLAKAEKKILDAWFKDGSKEPRPATPNLDALCEQSAAGGATKKSARVKPARPKAQPAQWSINDRPIAASQNKLSSVAWAHTSGIRKDVPRITTAELEELITQMGYDPHDGSWTAELPNGKRLTREAVTAAPPAKPRTKALAGT